VNTGILGTRAHWAVDLNLIVQVALLVVLVAGLVQAKKRNLRVHHAWMTAIVVINAVFVIAVMNPAFFRILPSALGNPVTPELVLPFPHVLVGGLAELMGIYAVLWMRTDLESRRPRNMKWFMCITFLLWALALVGGIVIYWVLYV
jgi:uncharacterized membrane protein YozB (DUF420 family)